MAVMTVNGPIDKSELGVTSPHEHAFIDIRNQYAGEVLPGSNGWDGKVGREHLAMLMEDPYAMRDNLLLDGEQLIFREVSRAVEAELNTFVDVTLRDIGRDVSALRRMSDELNINVVAGCGYYTADTHPSGLAGKDDEEIAAELIEELERGVGSTGIRPGVIGELGTSGEITGGEFKVLRAAARAHAATGAPIMVHLFPWKNNGHAVLDALEASGAPLNRVCLCHTDVPLDTAYMRELLARGAYIEFDNFGKEFSSRSAHGGFPSDAERLKAMYELIDAGYLNGLLASCDVCLKVLLASFGGGGYSHVITTIAEAVRADRKDSGVILKKLLIDNPAGYLDNPSISI